MAARVWCGSMMIAALLLYMSSRCTAFTILPARPSLQHRGHAFNQFPLFTSKPSDLAATEAAAAAMIAARDDLLLLADAAEILEMTVHPHRPLGCTVEESLVPGRNYVFVTKVGEGGHAEGAGLLPGDVVVAVSGVFDGGGDGDLEDVTRAGVEKV